jgi:hypothetical protein
MKKINFNRVEVFTDISHTQCRVVDIREDFANCIYMTGRGLPAHALALKIYNAKDGIVEIDDKDSEIIRSVAESNCSPNVIDAIGKMIDNAKPVTTAR